MKMCEYRRIESAGFYLTRPLPLFLVRELEEGKKLFSWERRRDKKYQVLKQLKRLGLTEYYCEIRQEKSREDFQADLVLNILSGRCLLGSEVKKLLQKQGLASDPIIAYLRTRFLVKPGIEAGRCNRCGNGNLAVRQCHFNLGKKCFYCLSCRSMSECRTCSEVWFFEPERELTLKQDVYFKPEFDLTLPQKAASDELLNLWQNKAQSCLLWAVCGAGKTEVCYQLIFAVLQSGGKVLLAIPRRDVVQELALRLQLVFPRLKINILYGGSLQEYPTACLTVATTHQVLRFYHRFDLVILDEADAYPYRESSMLHLAVKRAARNNKIIYLTATPEKELLNLPTVRIPVRHHGYPLPEPEFYKVKFSDNEIPKEVLHFLYSLLDKREQAFIFLPSIKLVQRYGAILQKILGSSVVDFSWSSDQQRDQKKKLLLNGEISFLLTTTIMERGITIPGINVAVLLADWELIFNTPSLVQIAGRVGRKTAYPGGKAAFFAQRVSEAMKEAWKQIREFNDEARKKGYIK